MTHLNRFEIEILEMLAGIREAALDACTQACIEFLVSEGLCESTPPHKITPLGLDRLKTMEPG